MESISQAVEVCLGHGESRDALTSARGSLLSELERARRVARRKISSLREGLEASEEAERVMQEGQLILAYQYGISPGAAELSIPELESTIQLDPSLSPKENAERAFRRYRKLRDAQRKIPGLIAEAEAEAARLDDLKAFAELAGSEAELSELGRELKSNRDEGAQSARKHDKPRGRLRFSLDGYTALVGRNARENEEVTFRLARREDLWFHARDRTGAHVVVGIGRSSPPDEITRAAAQVAAYFSEGRFDTGVEVDFTLVRNVRKIPGGPPGRVTYRSFQTVRVEPRVEPWEPL